MTVISLKQVYLKIRCEEQSDPVAKESAERIFQKSTSNVHLKYIRHVGRLVAVRRSLRKCILVPYGMHVRG